MSGLVWASTGPDRGTWTTSDGERLAEYVWNRANHPYVDRLRPLDHVGVLNNHAPWDHRWHHGVWWSWKFVNDVLFWEDHPDYGGNRIGLGRSIVTGHELVDGPEPAIRQHLVWRVDASGQELFTEERVICARLVSVSGHQAWALDWDLTWSACTDLTCTTTPYPEVSWGGYAGLSYRPARSLAAGERIVADQEREGAPDINGTPAAWAAYTGQVDGAGDDHPREPAVGGVAILQHPANPRFPEPVYTATASAEFGFLAAAPLMRADLRLGRGERLRLRYRVLVLGQTVEPGGLDQAHEDYGRTVNGDGANPVDQDG